MNIASDLLSRHSVIKILINLIAQRSNTVHGHLKWLVPLIEVLLGAGKVARVAQVFHADHCELGLRLNRILVDERNVRNGFLGGHLLLDLLNDGVLFPVGLLCGPSDLLLLCLDSSLAFGLLPENVRHTARVMELEG